MPLLSLFTGESRSRFPLRRRPRGRLERLRRGAARRGRRSTRRGRRAREGAQFPVELPNLGRAAAATRAALANRDTSLPVPDIGRAAAAARSAIAQRDVHIPVPDLARATAAVRGVRAERAERRPRPEPPQFLRERLRVDRVTALQDRDERGGPLAPRTSPLILIMAAIAGAAVGLGIGMWLTQRQAAMREGMRDLESSADEIKAAWPNITDDDIQRARGSAARLAQTIGDLTGEDAQSVRQRLSGITGLEA